MLNGVEDEWLKFLNGEINTSRDINVKTDNNDTSTNCNDTAYDNTNNIDTCNIDSCNINCDSTIPKCSDIYISTKTKISYLSKAIDLYYLFWFLPIIEYHEQIEGIIKKQMKFQCYNKEELQEIIDRTNQYYYHKSDILCDIDNPNGKIKFKHTRKISIGLNKKDILNTRSKIKSAFYNCFVIVFRIIIDGIFKEIHIKIFNTGKLEIPGIKDDNVLDIVINKLIDIIKIVDGYNNIKYLQEKTENVLINSNFNCGYYINREKLYNILRNKYNINSGYDPCSYPGIQCSFYYNIVDSDYKQNGCQPLNNKEKFIKISFMIFRTGSVLMVGKCNENVLYDIYNYIKNILYNEYHIICVKENIDNTKQFLDKNKKHKKKIIYIES